VGIKKCTENDQNAISVATYIDGQDPQLEEKLILENGHNVLVSDMISLNRAIPDYRNDACKARQYLRDLPKVSVIIPFYDEHISTLLRTIHSVINRTPKELLQEIILVNDDSHKHYEQLAYHITAKKWSDKVLLLDMEEQSGPIWSRLAGARLARGDILLFMDCHVEAGYNYLPPLIEPIAKNYRVVTIPTLDAINKNNYEVTEVEAARTVFDWHFHAQRIPLTRKDQEQKADEPYFTPIIYGTTYAISAKFFWELKPDSGLITHGADFLEMSFKINLCGGMTLEHPCSRVAHLYRRFPHEKHNNDIDFKAMNNKRVAEIWLEEYKESLYSRHPERYKRVEVREEDIAEQMALKESLQCLPMSYFFQKLAPDMLDRYPLEEYRNFASGAVGLNIFLGFLR
jgi:polypeptide N-acetylgalactosaminyltransferase